MNNTTANMPLKDSLKPSPLALLPIGVFLVIYAGSGIIFHDFYNMPAIIAFLAALLTAFLQTRTLSFSEKITGIAKCLADENIITMCLIFLTAGAFSGAVSAAGGVEHTVNLGLKLLPASWSAAGLFIIGCFLSISMGTSVGTISALAPIAVGISEKTSISLAMCIGAVISGAMFGDNLSMISDTTIAATDFCITADSAFPFGGRFRLRKGCQSAFDCTISFCTGKRLVRHECIRRTDFRHGLFSCCRNFHRKSFRHGDFYMYGRWHYRHV